MKTWFNYITRNTSTVHDFKLPQPPGSSALQSRAGDRGRPLGKDVYTEEFIIVSFFRGSDGDPYWMCNSASF